MNKLAKCFGQRPGNHPCNQEVGHDGQGWVKGQGPAKGQGQGQGQAKAKARAKAGSNINKAKEDEEKKVFIC